MKKNKKKTEMKIPTTIQLKKELTKEIYKYQYKKILKSTIYVIILVIAISILIATLIFPVLKIYGDSMNPTLVNEDIVLCVKKENIKVGDIIAFYYNNRVLVKRVIAISSDWVNIDSEGNVFVNNKILKESYLEEKSYGNVNIEFPYQVPENTYFILGDNRELSIDSRNSLIGTIDKEKIIGKAILKLWPMKRIGFIN